MIRDIVGVVVSIMQAVRITGVVYRCARLSRIKLKMIGWAGMTYVRLSITCDKIDCFVAVPSLDHSAIVGRHRRCDDGGKNRERRKERGQKRAHLEFGEGRSLNVSVISFLGV